MDRSMGSTRVRAIVAVAAAALLVAGCGQPREEDNAALDAIRLAADNAAEAGSSRMTMTMTMTGMPGTDEFVTVGRGVFDTEREIGKMTMSMTGMAGMPSMQMDVVSDGMVVYMRVPQMASMLGGKSWIKMDMAAMGEMAGVDIDALSQMGQSDPTQYLAYLRGAADRVEVIGEQELRGIHTTHYFAETDLARAAENAPEEVRERAEASIEYLKGLLEDGTMPINVWIDDEGLPRRMTTSYEMRMPETDQTIDFEMEMDILEYGVKVRAQPPPESATVDFADLMGVSP